MAAESGAETSKKTKVVRTLKYLCGILQGKWILDDTGMKNIPDRGFALGGRLIVYSRDQ